MDFSLSSEHEILRESVRSFAENEIQPVARELDEKEEFSYETMQKMAELGLFGVFVSEKYGGGIWMDTNPWHTSHWGYRLFSKREEIDPKDAELYALFEQPGVRTPDAENLENLDPAYYRRLTSGKDSDWIKSYIDGQFPSQAEGSVWGPQVDLLEQKGGILDFEHPNDGIFTSWDLGYSDSTAIWFWRINKHSVADIIDHYEAHGEALSHYFDVLATRGSGYVKHWLPHDARARTLPSGLSVLDQFSERF